MTKLSREELLDEATRVAEEYRDSGYSLTLRQLYYQLVSRDLIPNAQESYKRLGDVLGDARMVGRFDPELVVDRGRSAGGSKQEDCKVSVRKALMEAGKYVHEIPSWTIDIDRWFGQRSYVSVWVEKEALSGVFEGPCEDLGVGFFACKGYPSHSALWEWLQHLQDAYRATLDGQVRDDSGNVKMIAPMDRAVVLYFGDHDPDGWQIPRSAEETLNTLADVYRLDVPTIEFVRVALNADQIKKYAPPPFPAKESSSRYESYVREHRLRDAWELDALRPDVLDFLIRSNVLRYWNQAIRDEWVRFADANRDRLREKMTAGSWLADALGGRA